MPSLDWNGKQRRHPQPASLTLDSLIHPGAIDFPNPNPPNRLYLGDNFAVMSSLLDDYDGKIDLIYVDPPFFTNRKFPARIGRGEDSRKPAEWQLAEGYGDSWPSLDDYLQFLYERLHLMHRLLSPTGSLYLHLDWHADAYARLILDEIFGPERLLNEIIWAYHGPSPIRTAFNRKHDTILAYTKSETYTFNADAVRIPYDPTTVKTFAASPKAGFGKVPDLQRGKVPEDWWYFPVVARLHSERTGYPTQKPEALLARIILASSNPGDLVADFFCGSGTTPLVAARHGRNFLASDATFRAIHTARTRLVREKSQPFAIFGSLPVESECPFRFQVEQGQVSISQGQPPAYWEIDPDWDGQIFKSHAQAVLPPRNGSIPLSLSLPPQTGKICVRAVAPDGQHFQTVLE